MSLRRFSWKDRPRPVQFCDRRGSICDARGAANAERERVRQWVALQGPRAF
jgi:hypothetical protein